MDQVVFAHARRRSRWHVQLMSIVPTLDLRRRGGAAAGPPGIRTCQQCTCTCRCRCLERFPGSKSNSNSQKLRHAHGHVSVNWIQSSAAALSCSCRLACASDRALVDVPGGPTVTVRAERTSKFLKQARSSTGTRGYRGGSLPEISTASAACTTAHVWAARSGPGVRVRATGPARYRC